MLNHGSINLHQTFKSPKCMVFDYKVIDGTAVIDKEKCIDCGICIDTCPVEAIKE